LNSDGVYDLQISVNKIYTNGIAQMEFKLINENIPTEEQSSAEEQTQNETPTEKSNNLILIIIGGIILIGIIFVLIKLLSAKKFEKKYGRKW
jgi:flagellar biosynthesis/type III secretory pathway M-ring protein FliF/YscJ